MQPVMAHFDPHGLFDSHQSAYRPGHRVETAIQHMYSSICEQLYRGQTVFLVLLDHEHLIDILASKFKIGRTVLSWIRSYLSDDFYRVKIDSDLSEPICSNAGVLQGSVLGPILFNCVMASLPKLLSSIGIKSHMYVEDTQFWVSVGDNDELNNEATARRRIVQAFSIISNFMKSSHLKLNPSKTQFIPFSRKTNPSSFSPLLLDDQVYVSPATEVSNLGVLWTQS